MRLDLEGFGNALDVVDRNIFLAALDRPNIRAMEARLVSKSLLRQTALCSKASDAVTYNVPKAGCHRCDDAAQPIPRTTAYR